MNNKSSQTGSLCSLSLCRNRKGALRPIAGTYSDIGLRESNDDLVFAGDLCRLYVALDGIGGHPGGGDASRIVLQRLREKIETMCDSAAKRPDRALKAAVAEAISEATSEMVEVAERTPEYNHMGTVFSLAYIADDTLLYTRVGDARVYLVRQGVARRLTSDETYVQLMVDVGVIKPDDVPDHPMRNVVLNAVGARVGEGAANVYTKLLLPGDSILLTTDGVSDCLGEGELARLVGGEEDPSVVAKKIVDAALDAGSRDNASCVVVRLEKSAESDAERRDDLHTEVERLHEMLATVGPIDDDIRGELQQVASDIQVALRSDGASELQSLGRELGARALEFEVNHPHLTNTIASITNLLAGIGI